MARYIDADKLKQVFHKTVGVFNVEYTTQYILRKINDTPTADVVEVVRCKKCTQSKEYPMRIICRRFGRDTIENGYCSYGERRDA